MRCIRFGPDNRRSGAIPRYKRAVSETERIIHLCQGCGTPGVTREAWAVWDVPAQAWVLGELFDYAFCHRCHRRTRLETRKVGDMGDETPGVERPDVEE